MANDIDLKGRIARRHRRRAGLRQGHHRALREIGRQGRDLGPRHRRWREKTAEALGDKRRRPSPATSPIRPPSPRRATPRSKALGRIDILVNNAGIAGANAKVWETDVEEWRKVMRINLDGPFICSRAVVPLMIAQNYGRIVNIASIAGKEGNPNAAHYSASKAGVIALTKSLGKELAGYDIAVNAVTPAAAKTAIFDQITQEHIDFMLSKIPRNRFVTVEEVAALVAWIASAENSFTTGAVFDISGGRATY